MLPATPAHLTPGYLFPTIQVEKQQKNGRFQPYSLDGTTCKTDQLIVIISIPLLSPETNRLHLQGFREASATFSRLHAKVVVVSSNSAAFSSLVTLYDTVFGTYREKMYPENARLMSDTYQQYGKILVGTPEGNYSLRRSSVIVRYGVVEHVAVERDDDACIVTSATNTIEKIMELLKWRIGMQLPEAIFSPVPPVNTLVRLPSLFREDELGVIVSVPFMGAGTEVPDIIGAYRALANRVKVVVITTLLDPVLEASVPIRRMYAASAGNIRLAYDKRNNIWTYGCGLVYTHPRYTRKDVYHPFCMIVRNRVIVDLVVEPHDSFFHVIPAATAEERINALL